MDEAKKLRAIDLYSGVGGWALGLRLAGIDVVASYERWAPANVTNFKNNRHQAQTVDIRLLSLADLPQNIDIVVGSPPCTQFSFSNRGGSGDIDDGLKDIVMFLTIVDHLKPKLWAMENVPRVAKILEHELQAGGRLARFQHLKMVPHVVNMEDFGLPQRRRRCIAGNFDFNLLRSYATTSPRRTLGNVINAFAADPVIDPLYGLQVKQAELRDHVTEAPLNEEEVRINMAGKVLHPVYNSMAFPDPLDKSVRTITATCTRVSRESIVIENPGQPGTYRRLTVRERACLQGFPLTFQFYGTSYAQKLRMVGNAVPPSFTYYVAQALLRRKAGDVPPLSSHAESLGAPVPPAEDVCPDKPGFRYPSDRKFRFAIPSLRLKSGVRFELANSFPKGVPNWAVAFYFGTSKSIKSLSMDRKLHLSLLGRLPKACLPAIQSELSRIAGFIRNADIANLQKVWSHAGLGLTRPFTLLDELDESGRHLIEILKEHEVVAQEVVGHAILSEYGEKKAAQLPGQAKLARNAVLILSGLLIGSLANAELALRVSTAQPKGKLAA